MASRRGRWGRYFNTPLLRGTGSNPERPRLKDCRLLHFTRQNNMALRLQASGLAIALVADRVSPTSGFENACARLRPTRDHVHQKATPPPRPRRPRRDRDVSTSDFELAARAPTPGMAIAGSGSHDDMSSSHPGATRGECFDADMAALSACVGVGGSEQVVFHLRTMRLRYILFWAIFELSSPYMCD